MTFDNLSNIINKYQSEKPKETKLIYKDMFDIVLQLRKIKQHISFQLKDLVDGDIVNDDVENELLQDSKLLRNYINSM